MPQSKPIEVVGGGPGDDDIEFVNVEKSLPLLQRFGCWSGNLLVSAQVHV